MKVALSASFWNEPKVRKLLHECDRIYTTQVENYGRLIKEFGVSKICIIPDATNDLMDFLQRREHEHHPDVEVTFVTYVDLYKLHISK